MSTVAEVRLWGRTIGAVALANDAKVAAFEYDPAFVRSGIELAPLMMLPSNRVYSFPTLARQTFHGLPAKRCQARDYRDNDRCQGKLS